MPRMRLLAAVTVLAAVAGCQSGGRATSAGAAGTDAPAASTASPSVSPSSVSPSSAAAAPSPPDVAAWSRHRVLHPPYKYVGLAVAGGEPSLARVTAFGRQVGRTPHLLEYFLDWTHRFAVRRVQRVCDAGVVPALTWESWSWSVRRHGQTVVRQRAYAPRRIVAGRYDGVIRRTARLVARLRCPLLLRLDQEPNGRWYPWGLATRGMHNRAREYVAMWRHVWRIFRAAGADNVVWVWSPNLLYRGGVDRLGALYPGSRYVDAVGIDGYLVAPGDTPRSVFGRVERRLRSVAPRKPWLIAETGVAGGAAQPRKVGALLRWVARDRRLVGVVYLDARTARADWTVRRPAAVAAMRRGAAAAAFGP